ncbi:50S ribosomal protein L22 [Candidatus Giovannonibacteria bacterium RIFCSPHIGHO2_02_43_13]|uniref:Large ribosomal subunit protein uL22 n=1 Tax=Candidatus Giovannonibacteria bacterium RIFCSPHIGHO2_02_43_13 TaxID=1798330 RepID=A0A1F5WVN9_9BACT|nr:MAG: 50S ribosomal protein L22 [Candidatus Giovannonibacteria bacterium RIFCSPHIGHO2_12_FULL_44_42]OGF79381.1 MAG: 50S ribosomal protein L22 [Candidatus Giovannonibacteria bacterium RIFCSPHIGHO2_02_43_13]OGF89918.1 MAG: 50S ribosomal protein L22 [Candidatus Giovannonibacteria bacterium RIFCSPLOWO2_02_FULL_43_54]OGF97348.1 MAG: 50S ribosomal protein L22 [Candidatus Giovannonibacteria bacterium RIFCSPLOWO2_12_FULL_44_32]
MDYKAHLRYLRVAPRKVRLVAKTIRGKSAKDAETSLKFTAKKTAHPLAKLLHSAVSNAKNNFNVASDKLFVKNITVDKGPVLKRFKPRSKGMANPIHKHTSHITIILSEK